MELKIVTKKRLSRMKKIRSFKVVEYSGSILNEFIPTDKAKRDVLYAGFRASGIKLPPYDSFERRALRKRDMKVVCRDWYMIFDYCGERYKITFNTGSCYDGASVPVAMVGGNVSKFNQYVSIASLVHDGLFALKLMPFEDANNVFSALLRWQDLNKLALWRYMLGVRSFVGKLIYKKGNPDKHWLNGFVEFKKYQ